MEDLNVDKQLFTFQESSPFCQYLLT